jgi:hypothetical protein
MMRIAQNEKVLLRVLEIIVAAIRRIPAWSGESQNSKNIREFSAYIRDLDARIVGKVLAHCI